MVRSHALLVALAPLLVAACGGGAPPPAAAPAPTAEASAEPAPPVSDEDKPFGALPSACEDKAGKLCLPPARFVKRLCAKSYPDVALAMLAKGTPWTRGYLRVKSAEAWNASGGVSSGEKIVFDEEFVVLSHRVADTGGMQVSGAGGGYDVLRWDGTCASLTDEEVTLNTPPAPKAAKIPWKYLGDEIQKVLQADEKVGKVWSDRRKECKGATIGDVSLKCVKVDELLSQVIVDYVRKGGSMPPPSQLP
jgi:hypothetical protein